MSIAEMPIQNPVEIESFSRMQSMRTSALRAASCLVLAGSVLLSSCSFAEQHNGTITIDAGPTTTGVVVTPVPEVSTTISEQSLPPVTPPPTAAPTTTEAPARVNPSLDFIRSKEPLPDNLPQFMADEVVRLDRGCSGLIVNNYLLSATHCVVDKETGENASKIEYSFWQDGFAEAKGYSDLWTPDVGRDIVVAHLADGSSTEKSWYMPNFSDEPPEIGTRFAIASFPGSAKQPIIAHLTYIGLFNNEGQTEPRYAFALDADNDPYAARNACSPGASGAPIMDGKGHLTVLSGVYLKYDLDGNPVDKWEEAKQIEGDNHQVDLGDDIQAICIGAPVTRTVINLLIPHS